MSLTTLQAHDGGRRATRPVLDRIPPYALLDLHRLATLREVERCGSYSAAADSLNYTPSAVSQQMTVLARELGFRLFDRTPQGMRLTSEAEVLVGHVEAVFAQLNAAQAEIDEVVGGVRGRLRVGSFPTATAHVLAGPLGTFRDRFPAVKLSLSDGDPYESVTRLKERELDLALVFDFDHRALSWDLEGRFVCTDSEIECVDLLDDPLVVVMPRDHPLAAYDRIAIWQLAGERVLGGPTGCTQWRTCFQELCRQAGFEPDLDTTYRTADSAALHAIVATGRGLTLIPELADIPSHPAIVTRPLIDGPVRHVRIAALAGVAPTRAATAMVVLIREAATTLRNPPPSLVAVVA